MSGIAAQRVEEARPELPAPPVASQGLVDVPEPPAPSVLWTCAQCAKTFPTSTRYHKHVKTHTELKLFRCTSPNCGKSYARKTHLVRHLALHQDVRPHVCDFDGCGQSFATRQKLDKHKISHGLKCSACGRRFNKKTKLEQHRQRVHGIAAIAEAASLSVIADGTAHDISARSDVPEGSAEDGDHLARPPKHACEECGERFVFYRELVAHKRTHHPKEHVCPDCGKAYRRESALKEHQRILHAETVVMCQREGCGQVFASASGLRTHERVFHRGLRPFECRQCGQTFAYRHVLNRHTKTHSILRRPAAAGECDASPESFAPVTLGPPVAPNSAETPVEVKCLKKRGVKRATESASAQPAKKAAAAQPIVDVSAVPGSEPAPRTDEDLATEVSRIMNAAPNDWRGILGLQATDDAAKIAPTLYRHLMKIVHPDKRTANGERLAGGIERCNAAFDRVQVALEIAKIAPMAVSLPVRSARPDAVHAWAGQRTLAGTSKRQRTESKHNVKPRLAIRRPAGSCSYDAWRCLSRAGNLTSIGRGSGISLGG
jgi:hypothetical protein